MAGGIPPRITKVSFERNASNVGIGQARPSISWRFEQDSNTESNWVQSEYEIRITRPASKDSATASRSYTVQSKENIAVDWPKEDPGLTSTERAIVGVRAKGGKGQSVTEWHDEVVEAGLLNRSDWNDAKFIAPDLAASSHLAKRPFYARTTFDLDQQALDDLRGNNGRARIYATALGVYKLELNGQPIGDHVLAPGWQSYNHRLHYQTYEVPVDRLNAGKNTLGVVVGEGWYAGRLTWMEAARNLWGERIGAMIVLNLHLGDSPTRSVVTRSEGWEWSYGPILSSELYDGETFDAGLIDHDWSKPAATASSATPWRAVKKLPPLSSSTALISPEAPPIRRVEEISPISIIKTPKGKTLLDFGQNLVGWLKIRRIPGSDKRFSSIVLKFAEVLDKGELGTRPLRGAKVTDKIFPSTTDIVDWEPSFTTHGFRYAEIDGWQGSLELDNFVAVVVVSDMERLGDFSCSHDLINKLHSNVVWGLKGNFVGLPTDCPQRDERLGWTGDIQVFTPTAAFLYDVDGFLSNWLHDLREETLRDNLNVPPVVVPDVLTNIDENLQRGGFPQSVWCDVVVLGPRALYEAYGRTAILVEMYEAMKAWIDKGVPRRGDGLWDDPPEGMQFADWLDPRAPPEDAAAAMTDPYLVANAYLVGVTGVLAELAEVLEHAEDATRYRKDHARLLKVFRANYITKEGRAVSDAQTAYVLALQWDLLEDAQKETAVARLVRLINDNGFRIGTGFAGTPAILPALAKNGQLQVAYRMLQEGKCPSWLYPITMGATTIWERWDSLLPDGSVNPGEMTSFNHYALGSVAHFLHAYVGGLFPATPGWRRILVRPLPGGTLSWAKTHTITPAGRAACEWSIKGGKLKIKVEIPPNTSAEIHLPGEKEQIHEVGSGFYEYEVDWQADPSWPPTKVLKIGQRPENTLLE